MGFIRVRAAEGLRHEFDVSEAEFARRRDVYEVVDEVPVRDARPVKYVRVRPAKSAAKAVGKE